MYWRILSSFIVLLFFESGFAADRVGCPIGSDRVKAYPRSSYYRADGTFVRAANVRSFCRKKSTSYLFWHDRLKNGRPPGWPYSKEVTGQWNQDQIERVIEALGEIPERLWPKSMGGIYRLTTSHNDSNPASYKDGNIALYDSAFSTKYTLARVLAHELAHEAWDDPKTDPDESYEDATGWQKSYDPIAKIKKWTGRKDGYVEEDGSYSRDEDFANNIEYYLFDPSTLKQKTPTAYSWIKNHFGDKFKLNSGEK